MFDHFTIVENLELWKIANKVSQEWEFNIKPEKVSFIEKVKKPIKQNLDLVQNNFLSEW